MIFLEIPGCLFIIQSPWNQMSLCFKVLQECMTAITETMYSRCTKCIHICSNKGPQTVLWEPWYFLFYEIPIHLFTWVKQYPVEKVWLPKLHYRGPLNWQGNSDNGHWSSRPTDKGELIKNKNLIKLVLNQQQLQGIHAAWEDRLLFTYFIKKSHETH